jgi:Leucine-rich repeat (LRR) protein
MRFTLLVLLFVSVALAITSALTASGQGTGQAQKETVLNVSHQKFTDADMARIPSPEKLEVLVLRGYMGYGANKVTDEGIAHVVRCKNLRVLSAGGLGLSDRALESIGQLTALEELNLDGNKITGEGLRHLAGLKKLRRLNLDYNPVRPDTLAALTPLPNLMYLWLHSLPGDDRLLELCSKLADLEELRLSDNTAEVTDRGIAHLTRLKHLKNMSLRGAKGVSDVGLAQLASFPGLQELSLHELRSVTPRGVDVIGRLTELRRLEIAFVPMDDKNIASLAALKNLEHLMIWGTWNKPQFDVLGELRWLRTFRTNEVVSSSAIRGLARHNNLESIGDELTEITDEDLKYLARLPRLRSLILSSDQITAASLPTLAKMTALRELYVTDKVRISPEQLTQLGETALTRCLIGSYRAPYTVYHKPPDH